MEPETRLENHNNMKRSFSSNSESQNHLDSPLRFHSPLRPDQGDPTETSPYASPIASPEKPSPGDSKAIVTIDKYTQFSPHPSPFQPPDNAEAAAMEKAQTPSQPSMLFSGALKGDGPGTVTRVGHAVGEGKLGTMGSVARTSRREEMLKIAELGFRISEVVLCLISFSVMAADKTQGWSGDSFDRYKEYRYALSMNVIGFAYSGFQAFDLGYNIASGKHVLRHHLRRQQFNFFLDQILAYLLISSSSSAATRVVDWQSNWGKDEFTEMASASVAMAFLAFFAFALSSLISGYNLITA